jgi:hypothetical protein
VGSNHLKIAPLAAALLGALALGFAAGTEADAAKERRDGDSAQRYKIPVDQPESVVYDRQTDAFYGGSSQANGEVYKAKLNGKKKIFMQTDEDDKGNLDDRTQTEGFNVDKEGRLYIAGGASAKLHVYKLPSGRKIAEFDTPPGSFVNDVDIDPNNSDVYFTDSNLPSIYRVTKEQVETGTGAPEVIDLANDVDYGSSTRTNNKLEANGIRFTPGGEFIIFDSLNNGELYRLTPPPAGQPGQVIADPEIITITGVTLAQIGNDDGLEFLDGNTLYSVDNAVKQEENPVGGEESPERVLKLRLSGDYRSTQLREVVTSEEFQTPTSVSLAPKGRLLINANAEFFAGAMMPPFYVLSIPRP